MILESIGIFLSKIMCFTAYVNSSSSFPKPLTASEESEYLRRFKAGDTKARDILIHHNLRLVAHIVKKYSGSYEADDLISVGSLGLIKAINTYEPGHNTQFSTYAARCIENEILMLLRVNKKHSATLSTEDTFATDDDGCDMTVLDLVSDEAQNVEANAENSIVSQKLVGLMRSVLSAREYEIICMRYGFDGHTPLTQREVASKLGISRSYISRLETKAVDILRTQLLDNSDIL